MMQADLELSADRYDYEEKMQYSTLTFEDINYTVAKGKQILQHISGFARAGDFVALMGSSGSITCTCLRR